ncbi:hypothetical protein NONI108955_40425 [Nocardia ninae]|uniref:Uncharacterized protein n=1 Tax=Nocardia ninae NBRC 108245 TaxID=1210091 RepID=A0A511MCS1_9NOCA|nr:hypothetical protein [Nocardia ninae]GEM38463.1 hypothetical protein NN4_29820 [Nocardia ninae NBRC 108245]
MGLRRGRSVNTELEAMAFMAISDTPGASPSPLRDPARIAAVVEVLRSGLSASLGSAGRIHGLRVQALFQAVVVALGAVKFIKPEDFGIYYSDDTDGAILPADFMLVLADGQRVLVEVKNVAPKDMSEGFVMRRQDFDAHKRYAAMAGARLLFAHYWAGLKIWTLVDADIMTVNANKVRLKINQAMRASQMAALGDAWIATKPPLTFTVHVEPEGQQRLGDGHYELQIAAIEIAAAGHVLTNPVQKRMAVTFMLGSDWTENVEVQLTHADVVTKIVCIQEPFGDQDYIDKIAEQGFAFLGPLSAVYSRLYHMDTVDEDGEITALSSEPEPGFLRDLIPDDYWERDDDLLPIWRFQMESIDPAHTPERPQISVRRSG